MRDSESGRGADSTRPMLRRNDLSARQSHRFVIQSSVSVKRRESLGVCESVAGTGGTGHVMLRILVVDDEKPVREAMALLLKQEGYRVVVAECGHTAVSAIEAFTFDLVIVDIFMPGMNGIETIDILRQDAPDVPIIVMSGYPAGSGATGPDFFREAVDRGAT